MPVSRVLSTLISTSTLTFTSNGPGAGFVAPQAFAFMHDFVEPAFVGITEGQDHQKVGHAIPEAIMFQMDDCIEKCRANWKAGRGFRG
jgi:hypothetical protein